MHFQTTLFVPAVLALLSSAAALPQDAGAVGSPTSPAPSNETPPPCIRNPHATAEDNRAVWEKFADLLFLNEDALAAYAYTADDYIQHNPFINSGRDNTLDVLVPLLAQADLSNFIRVYENGIGMVRTRIDGYTPEPAAIHDTFRVDQGCIVEHWDVVQERPANRTNPVDFW